MVLFMPNMRRFPFTPAPGINILNILFIFTIIIWFFNKKNKQLNQKESSSPLGLYIILFLAASFFSFLNAIFSSDTPGSLDDFVFFKNHLFYISLYFLYFHIVNDRKTLNYVYWAIIIVTAIAGLETVYQHLSIGVSGYSVSARVSGPFGHSWHSANTAGVFFAQFIPVIFSEIFYQRDKILRLGLLGSIIIAVLGLFYTYSRKSYYALAAAIVLISSGVSKTGLIIVSTIILSFPLWAPSSVVERLNGSETEVPVVKQKSNGEQIETTMDESTTSRFILWEGAMLMWNEYPMGVGLERFKSHIGKYCDISNMDAHNYYVLVLAEMGLFGEITFIFMLFMMYREGVKLTKVAKSPREKALANGFKGALLALIIANTFGSAFNFGNMMGNFWVLTALVSRMRILIDEESKIKNNR
jgi:hypothetical protein